MNPRAVAVEAAQAFCDLPVKQKAIELCVIYGEWKTLNWKQSLNPTEIKQVPIPFLIVTSGPQSSELSYKG